MARKPMVVNKNAHLAKETLEESRLRKIAEKDAKERIARLESIKVDEAQKAKDKASVKMPVNLLSVYHTFLKRVKGTPVKYMRTNEPSPFGGPPTTSKIEARFMDLPYANVLKAVAGLPVAKPIKHCKVCSYTHHGVWAYSGLIIKFRVSMHRYKDKSVLFIFSLI